MQLFEASPSFPTSHIQPDPSWDFPQRESHYLFHISRLNELINDLRGQLNQQETINNELLAENLKVKGITEQQDKDLECYKETLKRLYVVYIEQQKLVEAHKYNAEEFLDGIEHKTVENIDLNKERNNLLVERDGLLAKLNEGEFKYYVQFPKNETSVLQNELSIKNDENLRLLRTNDELLDLKTHLEEQLSSLRFSLDKLNIESHNMLREKTLELEQRDRSYQESLDLKSRENLSLLDRVRLLESENIGLLNDNKGLLQELGFLRSFKPPTIIREIPVVEEMVMRPPPIEMIRPPPVEIIRDSRMPHNRMPEVIREVTEERENDQNFMRKIDLLLKMSERNLAKPLRNAIFEIWRLKTELRRLKGTDKMGKRTEKYNPLEEIGDLNLPEHSYNGRVETYKHGNEGGLQEVSDDIFSGLLGLVLFLQEKVNSIIFELFVRSINHANQRKLNSLILFILNLKELKDKYWKGLELALETYHKVRKVIKGQFPELRRLKRDNMIAKLSIAIGILGVKDREFRDNINQWFEGTVSTIHNKYEQEKREKNRDVLFLFRLLTVKYRVRYPLRGKSFTVDADLDSYLENKIIKALRKCLKEE